MTAKKVTEQQSFVDDNVIVTGGGYVVTDTGVTVSGDIVGRDIYIHMPNIEPPADLELLRANYLSYIRHTYQTLETKGVPLPNKIRPAVPLESIYVPLHASPELPKGEQRERPLTGSELNDIVQNTVLIEQVIKEKARVVILGDPGSGKTTLLKRVAIQLATESGSLLPIIVPLNAYAEALSRNDHNLQQFFAEYFASRAQGISNLAPLFEAALVRGQAVVLLDGLDESKIRNRAYLVSKIEAFASEAVAQGNKVVVTSRVVGYRQSPLDSHDWSVYTLLDFNQSMIKQFLSQWFMTYEPTVVDNVAEAKRSAERKSQRLINAINASPSLSRLVSNPFLLTILVLLMQYNAALPLHRVELYELYLRILINTWNRTRALDNRAAGESLDYLQTVAILGPLALWLRETSPGTGIVPEEYLLEWLTDHYTGKEWQKPGGEAMKAASEFLESVRSYSNILVERGSGYFGFAHLTFEEHLAARGLVQLKPDEAIAKIQEHLNDPSWNEIILLAIGIWGLVRNQTLVTQKVVRALLDMGKEGILLASASLEDVGEARIGQTVAREIQNAMKAFS